jgi:hypothetical protein
VPIFSKEEKEVISKTMTKAIGCINSPEEYYLKKITIGKDGYSLMFYPLVMLKYGCEKKRKNEFTFVSGAIWKVHFNNEFVLTECKLIE